MLSSHCEQCSSHHHQAHFSSINSTYLKHLDRVCDTVCSLYLFLSGIGKGTLILWQRVYSQTCISQVNRMSPCVKMDWSDTSESKSELKGPWETRIVTTLYGWRVMLLLSSSLNNREACKASILSKFYLNVIQFSPEGEKGTLADV